ncbi:MAG: DUF1648 domain-containing protein [Propionibacteriaceae bacterium]|nr:DUF1648 domain-containing protein [Propionibacteriaceae bacterium]
MNTSTLDRRNLGATVVGGLVVTLLAGGGALVTWLNLPGLPERVAWHWGPSGPDSYGSPGVAWAFISIVSLGLPLALVFGGFVTRQSRFLSPVAGALAALLAVGLQGMLLMQRGSIGAEPTAMTLVWPLLGGMALGAIVGVGLWLPLRFRGESVPVELAAASPRLEVDDEVRVAWIGRTSTSRATTVGLAVGCVACLIPLGVALATGFWALLLVAFLPMLIMVVIALIFAAGVTIDARGVRVRGAGVLPVVTIPLAEISSASVVEVRPLRDFGGWGMRVGRGLRQGFITAGGAGLQLERGEAAPPFVITLRDAPAAAAVFNTLLARRESRA